MRIASRINAALLGVFACGTIASFAALEATIHPRFDEIEEASAHRNHTRVIEGLQARTDKLATATQDYAFWDETYAFVQGENTDDFITSNLTPEFSAIENLGVDALIFQGPQGEVRWGAAFDLETRVPLEGLVKELADFSAHFVHYVGTKNNFSKRGLFRTKNGLVLAAIAPVLKSDRSGIPMGRIISAKRLDIESLKEVTKVDFTIEEQATPYGPSLPKPEVALTIHDDHIEAVSRLDSLTGEPLGWLKVNSPRDVSRMGNMAIRSALLLMIIAAMLATAVLWFFLKYTVVQPIEDLKRHISTAGGSGTIRPTAAVARKDEIGDLALSFNAMADQVNHLRDALAESAYLSGLSEWAAGTLHNVRNGIAPATAATWQIDRQYDGNWLQNVETAIREHADTTTPADRRPKLNAFLVGSTARFLEAARLTTRMTGSINEAARSVVDMASEFESYARNSMRLEPVALMPVLEATANAAIMTSKKPCALSLPSQQIDVDSNAIVLKQILSNVFTNATEAIENTAQPSGRIEVTMADNAVRPSFIRITVADNGDGLSPEILASAFRRGVSTRRNKSGGLGLHWCANAVKTLGGSITVESDGPGCGAKVIIDLPKHNKIEQEAA